MQQRVGQIVRERATEFDRPFLKRVQGAKKEGLVGTLGDFFIGKEIRDHFATALEVPVKVVKKVPKEFQAKGEFTAGWLDVDPLTNRLTAFVNNTRPGEVPLTLIHEAAHVVRRAKGRSLVGDQEALAEQTANQMSEFILTEGVRREQRLEKLSPRARRRLERREAVPKRPRLLKDQVGPTKPRVPTGKPSAQKAPIVKAAPVKEKAPKPAPKQPKKAPPKSTKQIIVDRGSQKVWEKKVKTGDVKIETPDKAGAEAAKAIKRIIPKTALKPTGYRILSFDAKTTTNKAIYGSKRAGVTLGEYKLEKQKGLLALDLSGSKENKLKALSQAAQESVKTGEPLYLSRSIEKSGIFKDLRKQGLVSEKRIGKYYKVTPEGAAVPKPDAPEAAFRKVPEAGKFYGEKAKEELKSIVDVIKPRFLFQLKNRLKSEGGQAVVESLDKIQKQWHRRMGTYLERARQAGVVKRSLAERALTGKTEMSDAESHAMMLRMIDGKDPVMKKIMDDFHAEIKPIFEAEGIPLGKVNHYFPRMVKKEILDALYNDIAAMNKLLENSKNVSDERLRAVLQTKSKVTQEAIEFLTNPEKTKIRGQKRKKPETLRGAMRLLYTEAQAEIFPGSSFEKARTLELPSHFYETDTRIVIPRYFNSMTKRAAELEVVGRGGRKVFKEIDKIKDFEEKRIARRAVDIFTGQYEAERGPKGRLKTIVDGWSAFQFITKITLGFATFKNLTQPLISFGMEHGPWSMVQGGMSLFNPAKRSFLRSSGAVDRYLMEAALGYEPTGIARKWTDRFGTASGFTGINKMLQYWAGSTIDVQLKKLHRRAQGDGFLAKDARRRLKEDFNLSHTKSLESQKDRVLEEIFRYATDSQLQRNILNDPMFINDPLVRPFMIFKRFGLRQASYMKDVMAREIKRGNILPALRLVTGGFLGGEGVTWAISSIKEILGGEPIVREDDTVLERMLENIAMIGSFGVFSDVMEIDGKASNLFRSARFAIEPVPLADANKLWDTMIRFSKDWEKYGDGWLATQRNASSLLGFFGTFPRQAAKRLKTDIQKENRLKFQKQQQVKQVFELWLDGKHDAISNRIQRWNKAHPEKPINITDVSMGAFGKWIERQARTFAEAKAKKGTSEFRRVFRAKQKELRKRRDQ